jgi:PKD repeat protein
VQFTDTSTGSPDHWFWEFGDGSTSTDQNPTHVYAADGSYSVALTVANPVGRDYTSLADYIRVGPVPIVSFLANQTYGIAPLPVRFTDTSAGSPTGWSWDFGDGATGGVRNPVHTYGTPGTYPVSLTATNAFGTGDTAVPALIRVLNGVNLVSVANFDGLSVTDAGGRQEIALDTSKMVSDALDPGAPSSFSFVPPPSAGWQRMTFSSSDGFGFARDGSGIIRGNLSSCTLGSRELVPGTFTTDAGNHLPVSYRLDLSAYPRDAIINATIWEGVMPADDTAFRSTLVATSSDFTSVLGTAYTLSFVPENLSHVLGATLNLSVSAAWVQKYGNENNIAVVRLGDDGTDETLNPSATTADATGTLDLFTVPSPHGLSRFGLVSAVGSSNLIQMGTRLATQIIQGSGTGHSSNDFSGPATPSSQQARPPQERPAATYYGEGKIDTTVAGITRDPVIIESADRGAGIAIGAGTTALDDAGQPLTRATSEPVPAGSVPAIPQEEGVTFTGLAYDMGPDGATFHPPATVSFTVPSGQWSQDTYVIRMFPAATGSWADIPTTADAGTRTVSGSVSHLCVFGLFTVAAAGPQAPAQAASAPAATPAEEPKPLPRTPMGIFTGLLGWISATALAHVPVSFTVLLVGLASLYTWTRRAWLARYRTWVSLYLVSLTGLLWASFRLGQGGLLPEAVFIATTVVGLNLIVHVFRFDRIDITRRPSPRYAMSARRW